MESPEPNEPPLRLKWEAESADWIEWARSRDRDHAFWQMNLPELLAVLPPAGELTLDVGCGEGRVARELMAVGHRVVGVESSPTLARAAREANPTFDVRVGDAAAMPLEDEVADLAVASLSLMNMDDMPQVLLETARVLRPSGLFCFNVLHPINSWGDSGLESYFATGEYEERIEARGASLTLHDTHRPLGDYFAALETAGFVVESLREPVPGDAYLKVHPEVNRWRIRPGFLLVRARRECATARSCAP